jgi:hypothetical protein
MTEKKEQRLQRVQNGREERAKPPEGSMAEKKEQSLRRV